jgi:hypothetical protein
VRYPEDFLTAVVVVVGGAALLWLRSRLPTRHDVTVRHKKEDPDAEPPE